MIVDLPAFPEGTTFHLCEHSTAGGRVIIANWNTDTWEFHERFGDWRHWANASQLQFCIGKGFPELSWDEVLGICKVDRDMLVEEGL